MTRVPELRFEGFDGEWEVNRFSELSEINPKSKSLPEYFNYVDLTSVAGTTLNDFNYIRKEDAPSRAQRLASKGDIFYQTVRPYQRNNYLFNLDSEDFVFSTGYAQIRTELNAEYLFTYMQTNKFVNTVMNRTTGTSFPAISSSDLADIEITVTNDYEEQEKIGDLFSKIDDLIEGQEGKVEKYKDLKKSMLQKMFTKKDQLVPDLRFDGFDGDWELARLDSIGKIVTGTTPSTSNNEYYGSDFMFVTPKDMIGKRYVTETERGLSDQGINAGRLIPNGSTIFVCIGATVGKICQAPEDLSTNQQINNIIPNSDYDNDFIFTLLEKNRFEIVSTVSNQTMPIINKSEFSEKEVKLIKNIEEQQKIGNYFKTLDQKIEAEAKLLDTYKLIKKSLLQKMFI